MSEMPPARRVDVGDVALSVHEAGPEDAPLVVLCHGWPELAHSWKNQIGALADAGFRVAAPDMRGFGASDAPEDIAAYGIDALAGDVAGLIEALGRDRAILAGHDWGGIVVWHAAMLAPERVAGVIGVNTPHVPRPPAPPVDVLAHLYGPNHYIARFQELGVAEAMFEGREDDVFAFIFGKAKLPAPADPREIPAAAFDLLGRFSAKTSFDDAEPVVPAADRAVYAQAYRRTGFAPGINWYRNLNANWARMEGVDQTINVPCLMIGASHDWFLPPAHIARMPALIPDLESHVIEGCGHWTQWEAPDALNAHMVDWLRRRFA